MNNILQYTVDNRDYIIKKLTNVGWSLDDAEDILSNFQLNIIEYSVPEIPDEAASKYAWRGIINARHRFFMKEYSQEVLDEEGNVLVPYTIEQLMEEQISQAENPLNIHIREEFEEKVPYLISRYRASAAAKEVLRMSFEYCAEPEAIESILNITRAHRCNIVKDFLNEVGANYEDLCR